MTDEELNFTLTQMGLHVPASERQDIAKALPLLNQMKQLIRHPRFFSAESAHGVIFPEPKT